jgi:hypothetical protein
MNNARERRRRYEAATVIATAMCTLCLACTGPTTPDIRTGYVGLRIICDRFGRNPLVCRAETYCAGLYRCPDPKADGRDATGSATWTCDDDRVARVVGAGRVEAVGLGDTVIRARVPGLSDEAFQTVSVFAGPVPLPTNEIFGSVWESGKTPGASYISGAIVEVLDGLIAGRTATSGTPPPLLPGYLGPFGGPGYYRVLGVPPGTYTLRVTAISYAPQNRVVEVPARGSPNADFQLVRQ